MEFHAVTIIAPEGKEQSIERDLTDLGVTGYTAWTVRGAGAHGKRPSQWSGSNVRIEVVVEPPVSDRVVQMLVQRHPRSHGVFVCLSAVRMPT